MDYTYLLLLAVLLATELSQIACQHEDIPYANVENICKECTCLKAHDNNKFHYALDCSTKSLKHILARWPPEFGKSHNGIEMLVNFSGNTIPLLQQVPATNGTVSFSCRHCSIKDFQAPTFMDVPNIIRLDLSWNEITGDVLTPDVFRGPYNNTVYEPISLEDLDLSHNRIKQLDEKAFEHTPRLAKLRLGGNNMTELTKSTIAALGSIEQLKLLDLSYNSLVTVPESLFKALLSLKELYLQGNRLKNLHTDISLVGRTLSVLDISKNQFRVFTDMSFMGLKVLKRLNISSIATLESIDDETFSRLESLEFLTCTGNSKLQSFNLEGLIHCSNLTELDISNCNLASLPFNITPTKPEHNSTTTIWKKLRKFHIGDNPWNCDCSFVQTVSQFDPALFSTVDQTIRCEEPFGLAGAHVFNLTSDYVCKEKFRRLRIDDDTPRFLRPRSIALTVVTIAAVIAIGTVIGFAIVIIRRKLKRDDFGVSPIRYTTVRNSAASIIVR